MLIHNHANRSRKLFAKVAFPGLLLLSTISLPTDSHAGICSPLQAVNLRPANVRVMQERGNPVGISFEIQGTIKNTNRTRAYRGSPKSHFAVIAKHLRDVHDGGNQKLTRPIAGGQGQSFSGKRIILRKPSNHQSLISEFKAYVFNFHCVDNNKRYSETSYKYDLTPLLTGGQARRISARIKGASEATVPPRNPNSRGAPPARR